MAELHFWKRHYFFLPMAELHFWKRHYLEMHDFVVIKYLAAVVWSCTSSSGTDSVIRLVIKQNILHTVAAKFN